MIGGGRGALSFRQLVLDIDTSDRLLFEKDLGMVQPVALVNPDSKAINVTYARVGGGSERAFNARRVGLILLQWTISASAWQDATNMDEAIKVALLENDFAVPSPDEAFSGPSDDAEDRKGEDEPVIYLVQQSALLWDSDW